MQRIRKGHIFWDVVARKSSERVYLLDRFGEYKRDELKRIVYHWVGGTESLRILKTDLFEEALGPDQFLFSMFEKDKLFGIDISQFIVNKANIKGKGLNRICYFTAGDVRCLPYKDKVFDIIISNSTLDHFEKANLTKALLELKRVLKTDGRIILTINNKHNLNFYFFTRLGIFLRLIYFPVEFYTTEEMRDAINDCGLITKDRATLTHLITPANKILTYLKPVLGSHLTNRIAELLVRFAEYLGKKRTKFFTAWFLAFLITKDK